MKTCQEMMTKNLFCCLDSDKVYNIAQRMQSDNISTLLVVENYETRKLLGIVTDRDLAVRVVGANRDTTNTLVSDVMTPDPAVCHPADDLDTTLEHMARCQIQQIPVIDTVGRVVGMLAQPNTRGYIPHLIRLPLARGGSLPPRFV